MDENAKEWIWVGLLTVLALALWCGAVWFSAREEARAFNRCMGTNVTTWEAVFADFRVMDCPGGKE